MISGSKPDIMQGAVLLSKRTEILPDDVDYGSSVGVRKGILFCSRRDFEFSGYA